MKNYFPMKTFQQDAVVRRLNVLYKVLKDVDVEYDSVSGDASFELDGDVTITGDLTITGSLTGAETQIANAVDDYLEAHPIGPTSIAGEDIAPDDIAASGNISAVGSVSGASGSFSTINGESNPSVKPIYCHPIRLTKYSGDGPYYTLTALIFNNNSTPFTLTTFKAWFLDLLNHIVGNTAATLLVSGYYNSRGETPKIVQSASFLYVAPDGQGGYTCGCEGGNVGGTQDIDASFNNIEDLLPGGNLVDAVNQIN